MKRIFIIIALAFAFLTLSSCTKKYDKYGLNCKVKSVLEQSYSAKQKFGEIDYDICVNLELLEFNNDRQMTSKSMFYDWGFKPGDELELREKEIYKYNDKGLLIEKDEYWKDGSLSGKETYKYNDKDFLIDEYSYNSKGDLWNHEHIEYNESNKPISDEYTYNDETHKWVYVYENNDCIAAIHYNNKEEEDRRTEYTYDNHHLIFEVNYEGGEIWCQSELIWDGDKLIKYKHSFSDGKEVIEENPTPLYTNKNGLEITTNHDKWGTVTYEYVTFDKKGNWTKRYAHDPKTNEVKYITERVITY